MLGTVRPMTFGFIFACAFLAGGPHIQARDFGSCSNDRQTSARVGKTCGIIMDIPANTLTMAMSVTEDSIAGTATAP